MLDAFFVLFILVEQKVRQDLIFYIVGKIRLKFAEKQLF